MIKSEVSFNLKGLEELRKEVGGSYVARVGILGGNAARSDDSGINNATLGAIQMFGSHTHNIPPRDFLLYPIQRNAKKIARAMGGKDVKAAIDAKDYRRVFKLLGLIAESFVQEAFETRGWGQWAPNKPATIRQKGSDAPLINTAQLRRAITSDVVKKGSAGGAVGQIST